MLKLKTETEKLKVSIVQDSEKSTKWSCLVQYSFGDIFIDVCVIL